MNFIPEEPNIFQGKQILIDSDRLIFNAREDALLMYSDKAIGFSTNGNFHFDTDNSGDTKFIVNAPNIYLGLQNPETGELPTEPAVLGHELKELLTQILDLFDMLNMDMCFNVAHITTQPTTPTGMNPANDTIYMCIDQEVEDIRNNLNDILSENTKLV